MGILRKGKDLSFLIKPNYFLFWYFLERGSSQSSLRWNPLGSVFFRPHPPTLRFIPPSPGQALLSPPNSPQSPDLTEILVAQGKMVLCTGKSWYVHRWTQGTGCPKSVTYPVGVPHWTLGVWGLKRTPCSLLTETSTSFFR